MRTRTHLFHFPNRKYHTGLAHRGWLAMTKQKGKKKPTMFHSCLVHVHNQQDLHFEIIHEETIVSTAQIPPTNQTQLCGFSAKARVVTERSSESWFRWNRGSDEMRSGSSSASSVSQGGTLLRPAWTNECCGCVNTAWRTVVGTWTFPSSLVQQYMATFAVLHSQKWHKVVVGD